MRSILAHLVNLFWTVRAWLVDHSPVVRRSTFTEVSDDLLDLYGLLYEANENTRAAKDDHSDAALAAMIFAAALAYADGLDDDDPLTPAVEVVTAAAINWLADLTAADLALHPEKLLADIADSTPRAIAANPLDAEPVTVSTSGAITTVNSPSVVDSHVAVELTALAATPLGH